MTLVPRALDGEVLSPRQTVRVVGRAHVLAGERFDLHLPAGLSISELLELAGVAGRPVSVRLQGHPIEARNFAKIRVKPGATLTVVPVAGNGNMRLVLSAVVAIAALVIAPYAAPSIATAFAAIGVTVSAATATAIAASAFMMAGTLALSMLFPVRPASSNNVASNSLNSIQGANNQANTFGAVPVVLGRHRQSPYYAAKPYTEISGSDQWLRLLFCLGYGPLDISDLKIGETPLSSFADYQLEIKQGFPSDTPVTLYPGTVDEVSLQIELGAGVDGQFLLSNPGPWNQQTTAPDTDHISLDYTAVAGIYATDQNGTEVYFSVYIETQYRLAGSVGAWSTPSEQYVVFQRSVDPTRRGLVIDVARGQYEVRVRRANGQGAPQYTKDKIIWTALRSIKNVAPLNFPKPLALVALRIRATDQLSGVINTFNCITTSLVKSYSGAGSVWNNDTASQNPADLFRHVLQSAANARAVPDSELDLATIQDWWIYCRDNGFKFNQVVNATGSVQEKLADIAASGRAVVNFRNGKRSVVWDRPTDTVVDHYTPRNSWGLKGHKVIAQQPHGWRVTFINEENGYTRDERIVYDDGFNEGNATLFEGIQFPGVTDPDLIWKHGRFHIAQVRLRPETISISVGWDQLVAGMGDRIELAHDVLLIGLAYGRVKAISGQVVTLDEICTVDVGKTYGLTFRVADDTRSVTRAVAVSTTAGEYTQLTLVGDLSLIEVGNLFVFGETNQITATYRIKEIKQQRDLVATLTLVDDAPEISLADQGTIPAYSPHVTIPPDPFTLPPQYFGYAELVEGDGATARAFVLLSWQVPPHRVASSVEVQIKDLDAASPWVTVGNAVLPATSLQLPITRAGTFSFRVRALFVDGTASNWSAIESVLLQGLPRAPSAVENLRNTYINGRSFLFWDNPEDVRTSIKIEIRKGTAFAAAQTVDAAAVSPWQTLGDDTYWVLAYATSPFGTKVYSSSESIEVEGSVAVENIVVSHDERSERWGGTFLGSVGVDQDNNFLRTGSADDFLGRSNFLGAANFLDGDGTSQSGGTYWSPYVVNTGGVNFCRVSNDWTAVGTAADDDFLGQTDFLGNPDFLSAARTQFIRVRPVIRVSQVGPVPVWGDPQVWSPDVYKGWMYQLGMQFEVFDPQTIAFLTAWSWSIDVPDRLDSYQNLIVPDTGLAITFRPTGAPAAIPFNGGLNSEALPHLTPSIRNPTNGDLVVWESLSLSGVTIKVMNGGVAVTRNEVNLLVRGY